MNPDDVEYVTFEEQLIVENADMTGPSADDFGETAVINGETIVDLDERLDRRAEVADLLKANVGAWLGVTKPGDPTGGYFAMEIGTNEVPLVVDEFNKNQSSDITTSSSGLPIQGRTLEDDTADLVTRPLSGAWSAGVNDSANGAGGGLGYAEDEAHGPPPAAPLFDERDELNLNAIIEANNLNNCRFNGAVYGTLAFEVMERA